MFRRILVLALVGLAVTASPALADYWWHSHMKQGSATASRTPGKCSIRAGWDPGSLRITCPPRHSASLTYLFPDSQRVHGQLRVGTYGWGTAKLTSAFKTDGSSIRVTLTVSGSGSRQVDSVSIGYYGH
jgi:hypothetical protein